MSDITISESAKDLLERGLDMCFPESRGQPGRFERFLEYCGPAFEDVRRGAERTAYNRLETSVREENERQRKQLEQIVWICERGPLEELEG